MVSSGVVISMLLVVKNMPTKMIPPRMPALGLKYPRISRIATRTAGFRDEHGQIPVAEG